VARGEPVLGGVREEERPNTSSLHGAQGDDEQEQRELLGGEVVVASGTLGRAIPLGAEGTMGGRGHTLSRHSVELHVSLLRVDANCS
jgi:hypothetical protein